MNFYLLVLCFVQGIGEFLPVSSSAHLTLISLLFYQPPTSLEWEVALHLGTLLSVILYFRYEVWAILTAWWAFILKGNRKALWFDSNWQLGLYLGAATIPALIVGYIIKNKVNALASTSVIGISSLTFGVLLYLADVHQHRRPQKLTFIKALGIGCAQILAFIPGASRSGVCITAARYLGLGRVEATRFAFLLSIPTVLGAVVLTGYDVYEQNILLNWSSMIQAIIITAILGVSVIHGLLLFLKRHSFAPFMVYRVILGLGLLLLSVYQWL